MVTKRIRSEYMKRFKDPKWETYAHCYEDLVKYRLSRRLLEQAHNPWFWDEGGSDTESSGKSTPQHNRMMEPEQLQEQSEPEEAPEQAEQQTVKARNNEACDARETSHITEQVTEATEPEEKEEEKSRTVSRTAVGLHPQTDPRVQKNTKRKTHYSQKPSRPKAEHTITKDNEESRHPFALYGSGERQADMASKRTHNVSAGGSTKEIHESALRAKTRREVEKRMKKMGKQRAKSTDQENLTKTKPFPDYNPWMTEYMRCFSARSQ